MVNKKTRVLIAHLGRLEKLLIFNLLNDENFEIVGIVSDYTSEEIAYFLEYDSNHGKFLAGKISFQNTQNKKKVIFQLGKKIIVNILSTKEVSLSKLRTLEIDFIVNFSENVKFSQLSSYAKAAKNVLGVHNSEIKKTNNFQLMVFHFNHSKFDKKNKIILVPKIEITIAAILIRCLKEKLAAESCFLDIIHGPTNQSNILDFFVSKKDYVLGRSVFNNLVSHNLNFEKNLVFQLLLSEKINIPIRGQITYAPVTTGSLLSLKLNVKKLFKVSEINDLLSQESDAQIGFSNNNLVSQDIVSTKYYAVIDKTLTQILSTKNYQTINLGLWFDYENSMSISCFKTLQFLAGANNG